MASLSDATTAAPAGFHDLPLRCVSPGAAPLAAGHDRVAARRLEHGRLLAEALRIGPGDRVLDIGCGTGLLGAWLADRVGPAGRVVGVDPLPLRVVLASQRHPRLEARVGRAEDLSDFPDASFDVVCLNGMLHWLAMPGAALNEARRVLKPGGRLGVCCADADRPYEARQLVRDALADEGVAIEPDRPGSRPPLASGPRLQRLLEDTALVQVRWQAHTVVETITAADPLAPWVRGSAYGNPLSELDPLAYARVRGRLLRAIEARRTPQGIRLSRHLLVATAERPRYA